MTEGLRGAVVSAIERAAGPLGRARVRAGGAESRTAQAQDLAEVAAAITILRAALNKPWRTKMSETGKERRWTIHRLGYRGGPLSPDCWHMGRIPREMPRRGTEEEVEVMEVSEHEAALAKARKEGREEVREALDDEEVRSEILGEDAPAFVRERLRKAIVKALDSLTKEGDSDGG
jgi:hypothetical protein